jgi:cytochrome c oxidase subunit IV
MTATEAEASTAEVHEEHAGRHPTIREYVNIAVLLAVLTAMEVSVHFVEVPSWLAFWGLVVLAIAKFAIVAGYYMHLKFDARIFTRVFGFGIVLACTVFALFLVISIFGTPGGATGAGGGGGGGGGSPPPPPPPPPAPPPPPRRAAPPPPAPAPTTSVS